MQPPVANPDYATTVEDTPVDTNVVANDTSGSGGALSLTGVTQGAHGTVAITPTANYAAKVSSGQEINAGSVLAYDKIQPWTIMTSFDVAQDPAVAAVIFTNVNASPYPGYELWIELSGRLRVRIISNFSTNNYIDVQGSVVVTDGKWQNVAATYDGSGSASGVRIYEDGVLDTGAKVLVNSLTGSIVSPTDGPLIIGNQTGYQSSYELNGSLDQFSISNEVRPAAYIAQYSWPGSAAPVDANTVLDYNFNEDAGTVAHDLSSSGYAGKLSSSSMWTAGPAAPAAVTYTPQAGFVGTDTFSYSETDGTGTATGQVTVTVTPPPSLVANSDYATTVEDTPVDINVVANDTGESGGALSLTGVTQGAHGTVAITPTANYAVKVSSGQDINAGAVLAYDKNQPWTIMTSLDVAQKPAAAAVIASNLAGSGSAHQGYQLWIDPTGHLRLRLISNYATGNYIEVQSSVVVTDGKWHDVAASYDGSGSASGVKIYLDGAQDTAAKTLTNALSGSIVSSGPLTLGNQSGYLSTYDLNGSLDQFSISNKVRSAAYIAQYSWPGSAAPVDANTALDYSFNEDAGTVAHDLSSSGHAGTLSSSSMWTAGPAAPATVTYTPQAGFVGSDTFSYSETDGTGTATGQVTVTVNPPPPVANPDFITTAEDAPVDINVVANDSSESGGALSLTGVTQGAHGTVAITPTANYAVRESSGQDINVGSVLAYDKNQPWTLMTSLDVAQKPAVAAVIASNLAGSAHQGYQLWIDPTGHLRLRLISNYATGNYIEVQSSVVVTDGKWHDVAASYDGSGSASGVKIYLDGAQDTAAKTLTNALSGSIVSSGPLTLGNQSGYLSTYDLNGSLDQFSISNKVRSAAYIAQYSWPGSAAPVDANTALDYSFNEDAGTVAHDLSSSGHAGTLSSSSMWTAGPPAPATVTYTPQAGFIGTDTFSYSETDGTGTATGQVTVTVNAPPMLVASADTTATAAIQPRQMSAASQQESQDLGGLGSADSLVQNLISAMAGFGAPPGPTPGMDAAATQSIDPVVIASQHLIQSHNG